MKDIKFMEELKEDVFTKTATITIVSDRPFYKGRNNKIYYLIR